MDKEQTLIYGIRSVKEAIESEKSLNRVYIQRGLKGTSAFDLIKTLNRKDVEISYVPIEKLNRFTLKNHQGVVATISPIKFLNINDLSEMIEKKKDSASILILDQLSDVRNFGAIGAVFNVPICKVSHIKDAIFLLKQFDIKIYGASEKAVKNIYQANFKGSQAIIMGSEGKGLSKSIIDLCDELIKIPLLGKIESLNVSVACGTILYEIVRQKGF